MRGEAYAREFDRIERYAEDWLEKCKAEGEGKWKSLDEHSEGIDKAGSVASGDYPKFDSLLFFG